MSKREKCVISPRLCLSRRKTEVFQGCFIGFEVPIPVFLWVYWWNLMD